MAEEEIDFFKPHPHPTKPRVKTSFFEVVPDAFDDKSLNFTGDHRRVKKKAEEVKQPEPEPEPEPEDSQEVVAEEAAASPILDSVGLHDVCMTSAEPWVAGGPIFNYSE